jgi:hypothetical protein
MHRKFVEDFYPSDLSAFLHFHLLSLAVLHLLVKGVTELLVICVQL